MVRVTADDVQNCVGSGLPCVPAKNFVVVVVGVSVLEPVLDLLATKLSPIEFSTRYIQPITIGLVYVLAGVTHFTVQDEYMNIVPYKGAWGGLWQLLGPSKFHVEWTARIVGRAGIMGRCIL